MNLDNQDYLCHDKSSTSNPLSAKFGTNVMLMFQVCPGMSVLGESPPPPRRSSGDTRRAATVPVVPAETVPLVAGLVPPGTPSRLGKGPVDVKTQWKWDPAWLLRARVILVSGDFISRHGWFIILHSAVTR